MMMVNTNRTIIAGVLPFYLMTAAGALMTAAGAQDVLLSPSKWEPGEVERYLNSMNQMPTPNPLVGGRNGAITGTYSAPAMRAGFEALKQGGSAVDAAITTANTQIVLCAGGWVSFTGILSMVYYDAETGEIHNLNACYNTVLGEDDPTSIPGPGADLFNDLYAGTPSGRTAMVPGYVAGVEAAHKKFGKLPFHCLFEPAIYFAENGFEISPYFANVIAKRADVVMRLPAIKSILCNAEGKPLKAGDRLVQKKLAETLRQIGRNGADYMYRGPWTTRFVDAVQAEGGKITAEDMNRYKVIWSQPVRSKFRNVEIVSHGFPALGGLNTVEAMRLYELSKLTEKGHFTKSAESLFALAQFHKTMGLGFLPPSIVAGIGKSVDADLSPESRLRPETTQKILNGLRDGKFALAQKLIESDSHPDDANSDKTNSLNDQNQPENSDRRERQPNKFPFHSDAVVAVDEFGNVCTIVHSINAVMWGKTGIFVDGISVNDSASFQQAQIAQLEPGSRLPDPTNPTIVLNSAGKPILACSSMGSGLHQKTNQCLINVLDFGMNAKQADEAPYLMYPKYDLTGKSTQRVIKGAFDSEVIKRARELGLEIEELEKNSRFAQGLWIGITIDPKTGKLETASPAVTNGAAFAR